MSQFDDLREAALLLNQTTDSYRKIIDDVEVKLDGLNLGIEAWVAIPGVVGLRLGYGRVNANGWGLMIEEKEARRRFNDSSRMHRVLCVSEISHLMEALSAEALKLTLELENAVQGVESILRDLGIPERRKA